MMNVMLILILNKSEYGNSETLLAITKLFRLFLW